MINREDKNSVNRDFHHPYEPYTIQKTFMEVVYDVLENKRIGILESPTGTGKSLSLICGAITWLRDHKKKTFEREIYESVHGAEDEPEWIIEQAKARKLKQLLEKREEIEVRLAQIRLKEKTQRDQYLKGKTFDNKLKKRKMNHIVKPALDDDCNENEFILGEYESDDDERSNCNNTNSSDGVMGKNLTSTLYSAETLALLNELGMSSSSKNQVESNLVTEDEVKIFYSSRTHSQLTQFINELRLPKFSSLTSMMQECSDHRDPGFEDLKHVTLGSRKNLCIHPEVSQLGVLSLINERCMDLQSSSTPKDKKCVFLPTQENQTLVHSFRDHTLANIQDIEDINALGKEIGICPYYASRSAIKPAEIVTLPYPLLLQKSAREALGINLKDNVVIIDEAHNLMDAISNTYSVQISLKQLNRAREQLGIYLQKFRNRLKGKNRVYIAQLIRVIDSLSEYLEKKLKNSNDDGIVFEKDLFSGKGVDQINFFKLIRYLEESKLARKVESYVTYKEENLKNSLAKPSVSVTSTSKFNSSGPIIHHLMSLLFALTHPQKEGRLFFAKSQPDQISLRFLLLDPSTQFRDVVSSARAVILAGGTMSPMSDYISHLFPYLDEERITTLSCGHVIPNSHLLAWNLSSGPLGQIFDFTFGKRNDKGMLDDLGRVILNICHVVPNGIVVFFPSYQYLASVLTYWSANCENGSSLLQRLETKKQVFQERKDVSADQILQEYAQAIDSGSGGLLFSVVGGKMSEGINFSDALGRCVLIVGLPFPNINSAEWKAKIEFIEESYFERQNSKSMRISETEENLFQLEQDTVKMKAKNLSRAFYENACMRAVNQSIGRAIRHKEDYAAIIMVDKRFEAERIKKKLPRWIAEGLVADAAEKSFGVLMGRLSAFFRSKKNT